MWREYVSYHNILKYRFPVLTGCRAASYRNRFLLVEVKPIQALPGVREIIPFNKDVLFFEPA